MKLTSNKRESFRLKTSGVVTGPLQYIRSSNYTHDMTFCIVELFIYALKNMHMAIKQAHASKLYEKVCYPYIEILKYFVTIGTSKLNAKAHFNPRTLNTYTSVCSLLVYTVVAFCEQNKLY